MSSGTRTRREKILIAAIIVVAIANVCLAGYLYYERYVAPEKNLVGIISIEGAILSPEDAKLYIRLVDRALKNDTVKAVVIKIDSPGGRADLIEQIYLDVLKLKESKPVVASVTQALSGGYYIAVAADYIYVAPSSFIGSVGVIGIMPPTLIPSEIVIESGPYKATGFSKLLFPFNLSRVLDNFVAAVVKGRGERLKVRPDELRKGLIYLGVEAVKLGLADEVGSLQEAIEKAAEEAGIKEYEAVELKVAGEGSQSVRAMYPGEKPRLSNLTVDVLSRLQPPPSLWYLYMSSHSISPVAGDREIESQEFGEGERLVLVDMTHGNKALVWELDVLIAELARRNLTVRFVTEWEELESSLKNATCLIVASPSVPYMPEEGEKIEEFVRKGGVLLLLYDPAYEYQGKQLFGPINSLSAGFGLTFAKGYLYNEEHSYGLYRHIYVRDFAETPLTRNLTAIVLFTATHIRSPGAGVAWAPPDTYSSAAEKPGNYTVIAMRELNGTVIAVGDVTFLKEPYCYVEDNYQLLLNIVSIVSEAPGRELAQTGEARD